MRKTERSTSEAIRRNIEIIASMEEKYLSCPSFRHWTPFRSCSSSTVLSLEAIFLSTFVLMKQNRMSKRADSRAHLDLQINLLAEKE